MRLRILALTLGLAAAAPAVFAQSVDASVGERAVAHRWFGATSIRVDAVGETAAFLGGLPAPRTNVCVSISMPVVSGTTGHGNPHTTEPPPVTQDYGCAPATFWSNDLRGRVLWVEATIPSQAERGDETVPSTIKVRVQWELSDDPELSAGGRLTPRPVLDASLGTTAVWGAVATLEVSSVAMEASFEGTDEYAVVARYVRTGARVFPVPLPL